MQDVALWTESTPETKSQYGGTHYFTLTLNIYQVVDSYVFSSSAAPHLHVVKLVIK